MAGVPHMLPDEETFAAAMAALQIEPGCRWVAVACHGWLRHVLSVDYVTVPP